MFNVISMFSGAGGLDMGFHNKGFRILWANDFNKDACDTYELWANYNKDGTKKPQEECTTVVCGDISKVNIQQIFPNEKIDVVLGGFPCQGFSLAGPRQIDDSRNVLYRHFVEMVRQKKPKVMVAENVIGIKTLGEGAVFEKIVDDFSDLGYTISAPTINAKNYGVPQDRMRVIFIGIRNDISKGGAYYFPEGDPKVVTLKEALSGLPPVNMNDVCQAPFSSRYMSRNRKRDYDDVSFTIPAMAKQVSLSPDSGGMKYVGIDEFEFIGNNRRLSYKEAAAIQTFPRDMVFCGDLDSKYKQIGNAVPVRLAEFIAGEVLKILTIEDLSAFLNTSSPKDEIKADRRITSKVINGKAFEYASLIALHDELSKGGWDKNQIEIKEDVNFHNIERAYQVVEAGLGEDMSEEDDVEESGANTYTIEVVNEKNAFDKAAKVAAAYLKMTEPIFSSPKGLHAVLSAMPDSAGVKGDVRDVCITIFSDDDKTKIVKELGISCKNNHAAVKHPRITENPDFAFEWTKGKFKCGKEFMQSMSEIQKTIEDYQSKYNTWSEISPDEKMEKVYSPIVTAFVEELRRLGMVEKGASEQRRVQAKEFAQLFFEYMFGTQDFYKFIKDDSARATLIYPYNMHGSLMKTYKGIKNNQAVPCVTMPEEIVEVRIRPSSKTTMEIFFDQWIISMRLHNADSSIKKTSLKFDVQIKAQPRKIMSTTIPWNE